MACMASACSGWAEISAAASRAVAALMPRRRSMPTSSACSAAALCVSSCRSLATSAWTSSFCEETDTNSPGGHRERAGREPGEPGEQDRVLRPAAAADAGDQRDVGD